MTDLQKLEEEAKEAEKRYQELQRIKELRAKIQNTKDLEAEVEPGFFKRAGKVLTKTAKGFDKVAEFLTIDPPKKEKKRKKGKSKLVYKGLKL